MFPFRYLRAASEDDVTTAGATEGAQLIAGGTTLLDLMRLHVMRPPVVVDITGLPLDRIEELRGGGVSLGALARNSAVAAHALVRERYPVLAEALLSGASPQLRNMATVGGNLLQRTRCTYFRDGFSACNKRAPGTGCAAQEGYTRMHALLGTSEHCLAAHPSDMCVALVALDAVVVTKQRRIPIDQLHALPGTTPHLEHVLQPGELITAVELPASELARRSHYVKVRDRSEFAFALASTAVAVAMDGKTIAEARLALGGVATKPWRARDAEAVLADQPPSPALFARAADAALAGARPRGGNDFKIELARRTIVRALAEVTR
jgi:xanthine dehydrogenase YagS FAD-binding subunit